MSIKFDIIEKSMPATTVYGAKIVLTMSALKAMSTLIDQTLLSPPTDAQKTQFERLDKLCIDSYRTSWDRSTERLDECRKVFVEMWEALSR